MKPGKTQNLPLRSNEAEVYFLKILRYSINIGATVLYVDHEKKFNNGNQKSFFLLHKDIEKFQSLTLLLV